MSAQGGETALEVQCRNSGFDENLSLPRSGPMFWGLSRLNRGGKRKRECPKRLEQLLWWWKKVAGRQLGNRTLFARASGFATVQSLF
jgi:hypothetical protein